MNLLARLRAALDGRDAIMMILSVLGVVALGIVLGTQWVNPDKRVLAVAGTLVMVGIAWRLDIVSALGLLVIALPFPRGTVFGSTNIALILLLVIVWLLRYTQREAPGPRHTPFDAPIAMLVIAYIISFYNVDSPLGLERGLQITILFLSCVFLFFLLVHNIRSEADLRKLHGFIVAGSVLIHAYCYWELAFPGSVLIPGWIDLRGLVEDANQVRNYRVGGPWVDYELLSEFVAMNVVFLLFLIAQARTSSRKVFLTIMLLSSVFILFATVTRGGLLALFVGLVYLAYLLRRRARIVPVAIFGTVSVATLAGISFLVRSFTVSGDLFARVEGTKFIGWLPESRAPVWPQAFERFLEHPIIGHGPYYSSQHGIKFWYWPHDLPLFLANCFGVIGLAAFIWLMVQLWRSTKPTTDSLADPDYVAAYLPVARVMLLIFLVDEIKIEYLRNPIYQFQPWVVFSCIAAAGMIRVPVRRTAPAPARRPAAAALPARS